MKIQWSMVRVLSLALLVYALACGVEGSFNDATTDKKHGEAMTDKPLEEAFAKVVPGTFVANPCTPVIDDFDVDFRGLRINAPEKVELPMVGTAPFSRIVVCGTGVFDWNYMGLEGDFLESIVIIAVDSTTQRSRSGRMKMIENRSEGQPVREKLGLTAEDFKNRTVQVYFNPDVGRLLELPPGPTDYTIYATLGEYKSNVVRVKVLTASSG